MLREFHGAKACDGLGYSVAGAGDVNRDGVPDLIVGASFADPGGLCAAGSAYVYSGADGTVLGHIKGTAGKDLLGWCVAGAGDVNQDGGADVIVGAPCTDPGGTNGAGSAFVYSIGPS